MAQSLPAQTTSPAGSLVKPRARDAVLNAATGVTLRTIARLPDRLKRLLLGGRSIAVDGNTLDTALQLMLAAEHASGLGKLVASENVAIARRQASILAAEFPRIEIDVAETDVSIPGPAGKIRARHYGPDEGEAPVLVFYHGGGFVLGGIDTHNNLCQLICRDAGVHVLSVDYRLAPEHKAPAAVEDAFAAYRWALDHAADLGADPHRVAVGGDSAGGNLAAVVSQRARDEGIRLPALQLLLYPVTNQANDTRSRNLFAEGYWLTKRNMDWFTEQYVGGSGLDPADPRVSPLLSGDLSGLPPALVLIAGFDPLRDEGNQYADALRAAGNAVDAREFGPLIHAFGNFFGLGGRSATAIAEMTSALRAHLSRG